MRERAGSVLGAAAAPLLAAVVATSAFAGTACAEVRPIARSGAWTSFGGRADDGKPVCGVLTTGSEGRVLGFKWLVGTDRIAVVLRKQSWTIPDGVETEVFLEFDRMGPWRARAHGAGQNLEFYIPLGSVDEFERQFRGASAVRVFFPNGTESPWVGSMAGSSGAMTSMIRCMTAANRAGGGGSAGPTQPFGQSEAPRRRALPAEPEPQPQPQQEEPSPGNAPGPGAPLAKSAPAASAGPASGPAVGPAPKVVPADPLRGKADGGSPGLAPRKGGAPPQGDNSPVPSAQ